MRATSSFETDVDQVEGTMAVVACSEEHNLRAAADILSNYTVLEGSLLDAITEVLRLLDMSTTQLQQYQNMLLSFEKARFETIVPQSAATPAVAAAPASSSTVGASPSMGEMVRNMQELRDKISKINQFEDFVDRINNNNAATDSQEDGNEGSHEEG